MAVKDKLVTLEDLKTVYEKIKGGVEMYKDITSTLTWNNASWVPYNNNSYGYKDTTVAAARAGVKVAKVPVSKGEIYRIFSWQKSDGYSFSNNGSAESRKTTAAVLADVNDNLISFSACDSHDGEYIGAGNYHRMGTAYYNEVNVVIPNSAKYMYVFDYAGHTGMNRTSGEVIVKKAET